MNLRVAVRFVRPFANGADTNAKSPRSILPLVSTAGIVAAILFGSAVSTASAAVSLTPLGFLPGSGSFAQSFAFGVNGDGSVVVGDGFGGEAFRWTSAGGMVGLGHLPGGTDGWANGVSADGSVIVGFDRSTIGLHEAFRWTSGDGMVGLGDLPGGRGSVADGVSADGSVIVGYSSSYPTGSEAFRWTSDGGMVGLGILPGGSYDVYNRANGVDANGSVIVGGSSSASGFEAFRWTSDGGMVGLGDLPGGLFEGVANGVSADGSITVGQSSSASGSEAFRWTSGGGMVGLGKLPGAVLSGAFGVNGDGSVVVGYSYSPNFLDAGHRAFYWTAAGGIRALWDVLLSHDVDPAADGWTELAQALNISADGNTIVGYGIRNDKREAFVAVIPIVPEPAGDFDHDGDVDRDDLLKWQGDFGENGSSDADHDNDSDGADFLAWQRQLGSMSATANAPAVPEPEAVMLIAIGGAVASRRPRRARVSELVHR